VPFEESHVDYRYIFSKLQKAGFDGWISYEAHPSVGLEGIASGAEFARRMWAEVAHS
jgi:sugar phosphate isomerase/epimerase